MLGRYTTGPYGQFRPTGRIQQQGIRCRQSVGGCRWHADHVEDEAERIAPSRQRDPRDGAASAVAKTCCRRRRQALRMLLWERRSAATSSSRPPLAGLREYRADHAEAPLERMSAETAEPERPPPCTTSITSEETCAGSQSQPLPASAWCSHCGQRSRCSAQLGSGVSPVATSGRCLRSRLTSTSVIPALRRGYLALLGSKVRSQVSDGNGRRSSSSSVGAVLGEIPAAERGNDEFCFTGAASSNGSPTRRRVSGWLSSHMSVGGSTSANVNRPSAAVSPSTVAFALARPMPRRRRSISTSRRS